MERPKCNQCVQLTIVIMIRDQKLKQVGCFSVCVFHLLFNLKDILHNEIMLSRLKASVITVDKYVLYTRQAITSSLYLSVSLGIQHTLKLNAQIILLVLSSERDIWKKIYFQEQLVMFQVEKKKMEKKKPINPPEKYQFGGKSHKVELKHVES